jgi:hypothetical protein
MNIWRMNEMSVSLRSVIVSQAAGDREFLASAIARWQIANPGIKVHEVLRCEAENVWRMALARRPKDGIDFASSVKRIADAFGADVNALVSLLRLADSLEALRETAADTSELLMAARDWLEHGSD